MVPGDFSYRKQRRFRRRPITVQVEVTRGGEFHIQDAVDISEGGLLLRVFTDYKIHDRVNVGLVIPGENYVHALAEVAYLLEPSPGIQFVGLRFVQTSTGDQTSIRRFIRSLTSRAER